ncbi:MAG: hypothetical protein ACTSRW_01310 [Candidatus Helarchaeota archaeon]
MSIVNNFEEAVESIRDLLEVEGLAIYDGIEVKYHDFSESGRLKRIFKAINKARSDIGFDLGLDELDIKGETGTLRLYLNGKQSILIKFSPDLLPSDSLIEEKVKAIWNFITD